MHSSEVWGFFSVITVALESYVILIIEEKIFEEINTSKLKIILWMRL